MRSGAAGLAAALISAIGVAGGLIAWQWQRHAPVTLAVGVDLPLMPGVAMDPTDRHSADLYVEAHPQSRMRLVNHFNGAEPATAPSSITALKQKGVRFFLTTQASSHAVPSLGQFATGDALAINVSATSNALSGRNDFFLRVVPDLVQEQKAIARALQRFPGRRVLVLHDTGNRAYTEPALKHFREELARLGSWQVQARPLLVSTFDPRRDRSLMEGEFDALFILAGSFQPTIGIVSQLFHVLHPQAPILLTPWARSTAVTQNSGPAAAYTWVVSPYPARSQDPRVDDYFRRFEERFGYTPYAMGIGTHQALELLDRALASGAQSPAQVKRFLLGQPQHATSFGPIGFDATGDVQARFHVFPANADRAP